MKNSIKYRFSDFTIEHYRELLGLAKAAYTFRTFTNFEQKEKFILWRHDIDMSVHRARQLAQIEAEVDVISTYFVHLHSEFYNALDPETKRLLNEIMELGHVVGLHFDSHYHCITSEALLEETLTFERRLLERLLSRPVEAFSFHNPSPFTLSCVLPKYAGMVHPHADYFQRNVGYVSDSNGYWRHRRLADVLTDARDERLQVLTHPEWWQDSVMSPSERVKWCIDHRAATIHSQYQELLTTNARLNLDW